MRSPRTLPLLALLIAILAVRCTAAPFVLFPKAGQLPSSDGRFLVRNVERDASSSEFAGTFHALWLDDRSTGRSRKLCEYVGVAAVAWSGNNFLVITQYLAKRTSRALVFAVTGDEPPILLDSPTLIRMLPVPFRPTLRENDHIFVESSRLEGNSLYLHVWGYGRHDPNGFSWECQYSLREDRLSCTEPVRQKEQ